MFKHRLDPVPVMVLTKYRVQRILSSNIYMFGLSYLPVWPLIHEEAWLPPPATPAPSPGEITLDALTWPLDTIE